MIPSYIEQGRITAQGSQYIKIKDNIIPIHESEYAGFKGLEFSNSNLALWLESRCKHIKTRKNIGLVSIDKIRKLPTNEIVDEIVNRPKNIQAFVFDSCDENDLTADICVLLKLEENGNEKILYKFGPSMINRLVKELVEGKNINSISGISSNDKAIVVAGSLSTITKLQISHLRDEEKTSLVILSNDDIENQSDYIVIEKKQRKILEYNRRGDNVILTTEY